MYELVYPLIAFTPLVLLWFQRKINRRLIRLVVYWYVAPALYAGWYLFIILNYPRAFQYQNGLIDHPSIPTILLSLLNIYLRHFFTGWFEPLASIPPLYLLLGLLAGLLVAALSWGLSRGHKPYRRFTAAAPAGFERAGDHSAGGGALFAHSGA